MAEKVIIVGAGIGGLVAALELKKLGLAPLVLEADDEVGGRMRTDLVDGFQLDRGFQILLAGYPWAQEFLDLEALHFRPVKSGALIWDGQKFHRMLDPLRHPGEIANALTTPVLKWADRLRLGKLAGVLYPHAARGLLKSGPSNSTAAFFDELGFSPIVQESFLKPFFRGIFLDPELKTASSLFRFLFKVFGTGSAGMPAAGMGAIPRQLATKLGRENVRCGARVTAITEGTVYLDNGEELKASAVICAVDQSARARILPGEYKERPWLGCATLYYEAAKSPVGEAILSINGSGRGVINTVLVLTDVAPEYGAGALISVTLVGLPMADAAKSGAHRAGEELREWFGSQVENWKLLRTVVVPQSLPAFLPGSNPEESHDTAVPGVFACGDYLTIPSQDGAAHSGQIAARAAAAYCQQKGRS